MKNKSVLIEEKNIPENKPIAKSTQQKKEATQPKDSIKYKRYVSELCYHNYLNRPLFKIFSDYFNILSQDEKMQKEHGIKYICAVSGQESNIISELSIGDGMGKTHVIIEFEEESLTICMSFEKYKENNQMKYYLEVSSRQTTYIRSEFVYKEILQKAIVNCDLKGSYFHVDKDELHWERKCLEKRDFNDIFLPNDIMGEVKMFLEVFINRGIMLKYLMAGNPGTGKTEATIVLANELNKLGVTVIKVSIGEALKEVVELAEILSPTVILLEDIDLSLGSRSSGAVSRYLQDFLDVLDGTDKLSKSTGIISTTNSTKLLDLAAQRPGRFDKTVLFDNVTKENIRNIILKSLRYNFGILEHEAIAGDICTEDVVQLYHDSRVTGAHIYNSINMILLKKNINKKTKISSKYFMEEIKLEIKTLEKIRKSNTLTDKLERSESDDGIGFKTYDEPCGEICEEKGKERKPLEGAKKIVEDTIIDIHPRINSWGSLRCACETF